MTGVLPSSLIASIRKLPEFPEGWYLLELPAEDRFESMQSFGVDGASEFVQLHRVYRFLALEDTEVGVRGSVP